VISLKTVNKQKKEMLADKITLSRRKKINTRERRHEKGANGTGHSKKKILFKVVPYLLGRMKVKYVQSAIRLF